MSNKIYRIQLDFQPADFVIVDDLATRLKLRSAPALLSSGIRFINWMAQKSRQGYTLVAISEDGKYLEPEFDFMSKMSLEKLDQTNSPCSTLEVRVQFDLSQKDFEAVNALKTELKLPTRAELYRSGVRAVRWATDHREKGDAIIAVAPDGRFLEPQFDFMSHFKEPLYFKNKPADVTPS